jgi:Mrp family chromosome partitioning ATPase
LITEEDVLEALSRVIAPKLQRNLVELGMIKNVEVEDSRVKFTMALLNPESTLKDQFISEAKTAVMALEGVEEVDIEVAEMSAEEKRRTMSALEQPGSAEHLNKVRHIIAVMSGKGGVGKSLVAGLLAVALKREEHRVGILDADITGPSIPKMFGLREAPRYSPLGIGPVRSSSGIAVMSINLLLANEDQAVIWRGPLIGGAIKQFWGDVFWGTLDYLLVDLPPGTADAPLTVMQSLPMSGVVLVTSPQDLAGMVVRKAAQMAMVMKVPILGLVENMSYAICPDCGQRIEIFGPSHAEKMARQLGAPLLGRLALDPRIAELCDQGRIEDYPAEEFAPIARRLAELAPEAIPPAIRPQ